MKSKSIKILIDTDIGDDVDDALAIALALKSPELEVIGITTVYKNVWMRSELAQDMLKTFVNSSIPVVTGCAQPFRSKVDETVVPHQCRNLIRKEKLNSKSHAVDFIIETVKKYPEVVITPIGPLTNIATAIMIAPDLMKDVRIVAMGGAFTAVYPEYNIMCDPEAASIVIQNCTNFEMVGLDVTTQCVLTKEDERVIKQSSSKTAKYLADLVQIWLETSKSKIVTLHDPLVIGYLVDPNILTMEKEPLKIELEGMFCRGLTAKCRTPFRQREPYPNTIVKIATAVRSQQMRDLLFSRLFN